MQNSSPSSAESLQETDETQLWLELLSEECRIQSSFTNPMHQEADELIAIMTTIVRRTEEKQKAESRKQKADGSQTES